MLVAFFNISIVVLLQEAGAFSIVLECVPYIATKDFAKGTGAEIELTATSAGVFADAVMLEPVGGTEISAYGYDLAGRKVAQVSPENYKRAKQSNPGADILDMNRIEYVFDTSDRLRFERYKGENIPEWSVDYSNGDIGVKELDPDGEIVLKAYDYDANGNLIKEIDALAYEVASAELNDTASEDEKIAKAYGKVYTYTFDNKVEVFTDPVSSDRGLKFTTKYEYDALGRLVGKISPYGREIDTDNVKTYEEKYDKYVYDLNVYHITTYKYDMDGNITKTIDWRGNT